MDTSSLRPDMFFVAALKQVQIEQPAYVSRDPQSVKRVENWWGEVIRRTAIGAGADARSKALSSLVMPH